MKQFFFIVAVSLSFVACSDAKPEKDLSIVPLNARSNSNSVTDSTSKNKMAVSPNVIAAQSTGMQQVATTQKSATTTAPGMNPPHGEPGHRCEIQVGAPLSSAPTGVAGAPTVQSNKPGVHQTITPSTSGAKTATAKGMNPPHGETGHRCDISVGAPLNSAPTSKTTPVQNKEAANITQIKSPVQNTPVVSALQNTAISTPQSNTAFTGKLNPAHGQPGHDCKVAVGQPLP